MEELVTNIHIHTKYSDGSGTHLQIAEAGIDANLDVIFVTDHNILVENKTDYYEKNRKKILVVVGEEIHDKKRIPQKNHLLVFGTNKELCDFADDPQNLINQVKRHGGLCFLAHPFEYDLPQFNEDDISWVSWEVNGYTGIELWNHLSELKTRSRNWLSLIFNVFFPQFYPVGPDVRTLRKWDELLQKGNKIVAIGGSDSHAIPFKKGPIFKWIFPYQYHFSVINTHLFTPIPLTGNPLTDKKIVLDALSKGNLFIGNDLPAPTKGYRFTAQGLGETAQMGDSIELHNGVTFQINLPIIAECLLIHNGKIIRTWHDTQYCTHIAVEPGVYRVEVYLNYLGKKRGWIFSNPIYVLQNGRIA